MSLITRCPACETLFKVVPDQLRISEGWVRCGQCDEIFDASLHLLQAVSNEMGPAVEPEEAVAQHDQIVSSDATLQSGAMDLDADRQGGLGAVSNESAPMSDEFSWADEDVVLPVALPDADEPEPIDGLDDVSFLSNKKTGAFWQKPLMRATLVLLSLTLLLGLLGQMVVHERDRIVALAPGLRPWLLLLCGPLNCTLSPLRRIESIVIDSSSFAKIRGDAYRLNFTLKNAAATALAVPAIELTLTDSLDQPVVRRVFLAPELGAKSDTLAAGAEWPASLAMAVKAGGTADRISGYRVLAFYP